MATAIIVQAMLLMLLNVDAVVQAVTCTRCNSLVNTGCGSTLTSSQSTCYGTSCFTFTGTADGTYTILRDCVPSVSLNRCIPINTLSSGITIIGTYCYCTSDYCNGGGSNVQPSYTTPYVPPTSRSLSCYKCSSVSNSKCESALNFNSWSTCSGASGCVAISGTFDGTRATVRDCLSSYTQSGCINVNGFLAGPIIVGSNCVCAYNFCNGGGHSALRPASNSVLHVVTVAAAVGSIKLFVV